MNNNNNKFHVIAGRREEKRQMMMLRISDDSVDSLVLRRACTCLGLLLSLFLIMQILNKIR